MFTFKFPRSHYSYKGRKLERAVVVCVAILMLGFSCINYIQDVRVATLKGAATQELGTWESIDFVQSERDFNPLEKKWSGILLLKELSFLPDGRTNYPFFMWESGMLRHTGDQSEAHYFIKTISGEEFLFLEYIAGDVVQQGRLLKWYVLKRK